MTRDEELDGQVFLRLLNVSTAQTSSERAVVPIPLWLFQYLAQATGKILRDQRRVRVESRKPDAVVLESQLQSRSR